MSVSCYANVACQPPQLGQAVGHPTISHTLAPLVPHLAQVGPLPFTGADVAKIAIVGSAMVLVGAITAAGRSGRKAGEIR